MKTKDIVMDVAYAIGGRRDEPGHPFAVRAYARRVHPGVGIVVEMESGEERTVPAACVISLWSDHLQAKRDLAAERQARRDSIDRTVERRRQAAAKLQAIMPPEALPWWAQADPGEIKPHADYSGASGGEQYGRFTVTDLLPIVEAALAAAYSRVEPHLDDDALRMDVRAALLALEV